MTAAQISREHFPHIYNGAWVDRFIVPVQPQFHDRLFTDLPRTPSLTEYEGPHISEGNAIKKAYLCHAQTRQMKPGDIVIFYRSHDWKAIHAIGVIDEIYYDRSDIDFIQFLVKKRTVYSKMEISEMAKKPMTVILFRYHGHLNKPVKLKDLIDNRIIRGAPISATAISPEAFAKVMEAGGFDQRLIVN